jgi:hypothetical protein
VEEGRIDLRIGASFLAATASHVADCPDLGPECDGPVRPVPFNHHVDLVTSDISLDAAYGLTSFFALEARFAVRIVDITPSYTELDGRPKAVPNDPHHHDVTIVGPTDPWLIGRVAAVLGDVRTTARFGLTFPLGGTEPNPYTAERRGQYHEHTQLGTGTVVPIVGLGVAYDTGPVDLDFSALGFFNFAENDEGYRAPTRVFGSLRGTVPLLDGDLRPWASVDLSTQTGERWAGAPGLEGDDARAEILVGAGVSWTFLAPWQVQLGARARVARLTDAASFDYPGILDFGISTHFGGESGKPRPRR